MSGVSPRDQRRLPLPIAGRDILRLIGAPRQVAPESSGRAVDQPRPRAAKPLIPTGTANAAVEARWSTLLLH